MSQANAASDRHARWPPHARASAAAPGRVLIADDSATTGAILRALLEADGHEVLHVVDGRSALDHALSEHPPDLLITDGAMPGMDGVTLCRRLRAAGAAFPIIFTNAAAGDAVAALDAGADDYMRKPVVSTELSARVRAGLRAGRLAAQLTAERDRFAALVSSLQDGLVVFGPGGRIVQANAQMGRIVGIRPEDLVGMEPPFPYWPPAESARYEAGLRHAIASDAVAETDRTYLRPDGTPRDVIVSVAPVAGQDGRATAHVATVKDITPRRAAERALRESEARHRLLADEQARLSRVAAAVAASPDPRDVFALVGREVTELLGGDAGGVTRFESDCAVLVGGWSRVDELRMAVGSRLPLGGETCTSRVWREGHAVRVDDYTSLHAGWRSVDMTARVSSIAAPVRVAGRLWGTVGAVSMRRSGFAPGAEERLAEFAALVGVAVTGADARAELGRRATTDPLTGLANRRAFEERLVDAPVGTSVALFDLDHFKHVNDRHGHATGDTVLRELADRIVRHTRPIDTVARIGGEEFALLLPATPLALAAAVAERVRADIAGTPFTTAGTCTASCGVAERGPGEDGSDLMRRSDRALYRAKGEGRNRVVMDG